MKDEQLCSFQEEASALLIRNSNILDILTKIQTSCAKMCRSTVKAATGCGCTEVSARKITLSERDFFTGMSKDSGVKGKLCDDCRSIVQGEIGETLFYIASLCNALNLSMEEIVENERTNLKVLGKYNLR